MWPKARKALVAAGGALASLVALGVLPSPYQEIAVAVLAALTATGVYAIPNTLTRRQSDAVMTELGRRDVPTGPAAAAIVAAAKKL